MRLRQARAADCRQALDLMAELGYADLPPREFDRAFRRVLAGRRSGMLVADEDGGLLGLLAWSLKPMLHLSGPVFCVDELVVAGRARGRGVGRRLLSAALALARRRRALRAELLTSRLRESYRRGFYRKRGFVEAGAAVFRRTLQPSRP